MLLTSAILAVSVEHHTLAFESSTRALVAPAYPLDGRISPLFDHVAGTGSAFSVPFPPRFEI
jgi:hypothetical protein